LDLLFYGDELLDHLELACVDLCKVALIDPLKPPDQQLLLAAGQVRGKVKKALNGAVDNRHRFLCHAGMSAGLCAACSAPSCNHEVACDCEPLQLPSHVGHHIRRNVE
jgi:hypothetical protein